MKKLLGVSLVAMLAVTPLAASAAGSAPTAATTSSEPYLGVAISDTEKEQIASVGYVKGAYNAAIGAVNSVATTANNAANKNLSNITTSGQTVIDNRAKAVAASGSFTASTGTNIAATTIGAAINEVAADYIAADSTLNTAISGKQAQLKNDANPAVNINAAVHTTLAVASQASDSHLATEKAVRTAIDAVATTANNALVASDIATGSANGTISVKGSDVAVKGLGTAAYTASTAYATSAQGTKADNAANSSLSNLTATGKSNIASVGTYSSATTYTDGTVGAAIKANATAAASAQTKANDAYTLASGKQAQLKTDGTGTPNISTTVKTSVAASSAASSTALVTEKAVATAIEGVATTANNAANKDLSNLSDTGKANVAASGTYNASTNYTAGTVGAAIKANAAAASAADTKATNAASAASAAQTTADNAATAAATADGKAVTAQTSATSALNKIATLNGTVSQSGSVLKMIKDNAATATYDASSSYAAGTLGAAIKSAASTATNAATKAGVTATISASTGSASVCKEWGSACTGTNLGTATVTLTGATYTTGS